MSRHVSIGVQDSQRWEVISVSGTRDHPRAWFGASAAVLIHGVMRTIIAVILGLLCFVHDGLQRCVCACLDSPPTEDDAE